MVTTIGEEQLQSHDDDVQSKEEDGKKENPDGDELLHMTNDMYIQIRLLRGVLDYYQHNKLYPHDHNPNSLPDFLNNWLRDNFLAGDFRELIHSLREKFQSEEVSERKLEKKKKKQDEIKILACMIEYYISEESYPFQEFQHYKVFYKKWLHLDRYSSKKCLITICGLKMEYKNLAGKNKGKDLVFSSIEDLLFFNLSDIIWGSDQGELSPVEDDMKFLAAMIDYYIRKWRYPSEETEKIERLKTNYKKRVQKRDKELIFLRVDDLILFKLSEFIWGLEEPSRHVDVDKKILAAMVDYYTSEWKNPLENLIDFHKNRLKMEFSLSQCSGAIHRLKRKYKEQQVQKKNKDLVFDDLDDIQLFKLSEYLWGSETEGVGD
ncbi:hypothetical protein Dsin_022871 [Dipteronia sinensis]|uniref:Glabrous enhancer-binding protein-like DBD domain-containing protein n=1 Tax=Dipteronia sinensis TaxID=43782 RepID=A0AAE0A3Q1_9ROSI|nr:hypothetical protein Dsin_022871 [Dipteronia sinensis]